MEFTPHKAEQPLQGMELQEKEAQKDQSIQEISSERTYSYRCLLILDLKPFRSQVKGKHSISREFENIAVQRKKLMT